MKGEIQKEGEILAIEVHKEQISDKIPTDAGKIWTNYHSVQTRRCCQQNWPIRWGGINSTSTYLNFCHNFTIYPLLLFFFCSPTFCHVYGIAFCDLQLGFQKLKQGGVITNSTWHTIKDWKNYVMGQTCWKFGKPFSTAKEKLNFLHKLSYFIIKN